MLLFVTAVVAQVAAAVVETYIVVVGIRVQVNPIPEEEAVLAKALMSVAFVPEQSGLEAARSPELLARQKQGFQLAR